MESAKNANQKINETGKPIEFTYECIPCAIGSLITLFKNGIIPEDKQEKIFRMLLTYFSDLNYKQSPPEIARQMHRIIRDASQNSDPYKNLKLRFNQLMLEKYLFLKKQVEDSPDPFLFALKLAIAGNIIDFGPNGNFDIDATIAKAINTKFAFDDSLEMKKSIARARSILYLGDNAGEIVLDRLFLETINHPNVYFAVRGNPIINDVTLSDAQLVGIDKIANVISNGDDAPGTILKNTSTDFQTVFNSVDIIISKGQGNFESLTYCRRNIYFLLIVKCEHVAKHLGCRKGDFIIKKGNNF